MTLVSIAGLACGAGALGVSTYSGSRAPDAPRVHGTDAPGDHATAQLPLKRQIPNSPRPPKVEKLKVNPQARGYRGGHLEKLWYFSAAGNEVPPQALPTNVVGYLDGHGDVPVTLRLAGSNGCVSSGKVPIYDVVVQTSDAGAINPCLGQNYVPGPEDVCPQDQTSQLHGRAIAVPGAWNETTGEYYERIGEDKKVFTLACMSGIAAKCVNWGYPPWGSLEGKSLSDYYAACIHAARAEYSSGLAYTCDGTFIDVYDRLGVQQPSTSQMPLQIEAAWGKDGPLCISAPRFPACEADAAVKALPECNGAALSGDKRARWPEDVLLVTRSTHDNVTPSGTCPKNPWLCAL
ncbi:ADYC domain-containing protein [Sorangium sp. So ce385]|uniref:ADYC domain-containing protein n=1 Tax=Sorangium sp. So ce385 TaxID=3133308 RepID=UPI003F5C25FE